MILFTSDLPLLVPSILCCMEPYLWQVYSVEKSFVC